MPPGAAEHRAGVVALLGRPNAGKSTLLNRLLGEKLAIVTAKPQTTRSRILGVLTRPGAQLLLLDTPGFCEVGAPVASGARGSSAVFGAPGASGASGTSVAQRGESGPSAAPGARRRAALIRALNEIALRVASDCDAAVLLVDPAQGWGAAHAALREQFARRGAPLLVAASKCDSPRACAAAAALPADLRISAQTGAGVEALIDRLAALLPKSPALYDADTLTDRSLRFLAAEAIREAVFEELSQELPYSTAVEIESFDESHPELTRIRANLLVERKSQKGIAVGKGGAKIAAVGRRARLAIEALLGCRVHLALWVKQEPKWSQRPARLRSLGYH